MKEELDPNKKTILVVDDEKPIIDILVYNLKKEGYNTLEATDGEMGINVALEARPDLILLDVMMPKMDGFTLCQKVREKEETPILFITAKVQEVDQLKGYELGCDDYIIKPFSLPVLLAKCKAITNRKHYQFLEKGILKLNTREKEAYLNNQNLNLKIIDYKILEYFIKNPNQILSREQILLKVWGFDYKGQERSVDTHIKILRKALGPYQKGIKTVIKQGYCFETKVFENG